MANRAAAGKRESRDALLLRELEAKCTVSVDGEPRKIPTRQLIIRKTVQHALSGDREARRLIWEAMGRLYPEEAEPQGLPLCHRLNASDALTLQEFEAELRQRIRAEDEAGPNRQSHKAQRRR